MRWWAPWQPRDGFRSACGRTCARQGASIGRKRGEGRDLSEASSVSRVKIDTLARCGIPAHSESRKWLVHRPDGVAKGRSVGGCRNDHLATYVSVVTCLNCSASPANQLPDGELRGERLRNEYRRVT